MPLASAAAVLPSSQLPSNAEIKLRIIIENIILFLLPALFYVGYEMLVRRTGQSPRQVMDEAPLVMLFVAGIALIGATLFIFGVRGEQAITLGEPGREIRFGRLLGFPDDISRISVAEFRQESAAWVSAPGSSTDFLTQVPDEHLFLGVDVDPCLLEVENERVAVDPCGRLG